MMPRMYHDPEINACIIQGSRKLYHANSLRVEVNAGLIEIWLRGEERRVAGPMPFTAVQDEGGSGFSDLATAQAYLETEFTQRDIPLQKADW